MHREIKSTGEAKRDEFTIVSDREAERELGGYVFRSSSYLHDLSSRPEKPGIVE